MKYIIIFFLLFYPPSIYSQTFFSEGSGVFDNTTLWHENRDGTGGSPNNGNFRNGNNTWVVEFGDTISVNDRWRNITIVIEGYMQLQNGQSLEADSIIIRDSGVMDYNFQSIDLTNTVVTIEGEGEQINEDNVLPIELIDFNYYQTSNGLELYWITASERENYGFNLYRNGEKISFISGQGYATETTIYKFVDKNAPPITNTYILQQIDFDGSITKYELITEYKKYKNPVLLRKDRIYNNSKYSQKISIYNVVGKLITEFELIPHSYKNFPNKLPSSLYLITTIYNGNIYTKEYIHIK